ncbi:MAG: hypothetical protein LBH11_05920 [Propionibacteriaceae bacterium]|jgi:hypothetical protein|nr:hypothetical protein [Propionibacteriaceae bacterium]
MSLAIDYCGDILYPPEDQPFTIGRDADLVLDDENPFLHRVFLRVTNEDGMWWLENVGSKLSASIVANEGKLQGWLAPGDRLPLVFGEVVAFFTAGDMTYELGFIPDTALVESVRLVDVTVNGDTIGSVNLTTDQRLLSVALAEDVLRKMHRGAGAIPTSAQAAARLGWAITKFNRKLDNVCQKLADLGVRGLHGGPARLAVSRKARLVEYAVGAGIVTIEDIALLPEGKTKP